MQPPPPRGKFVPHKTLREGWTYFSTADSDCVVGVKVVVTKVVRVEGPDGKPASNPDGSPVYYFSSTNVVRILMKEEWEVMRREFEYE